MLFIPLTSIVKAQKDIVTVTKEQIKQTIFNFLHYDHMVVESSGTVATGLLTGKINLNKHQNIGIIVFD